jgi:outer membrane protein assembly factor BamB
MSADLSGNGNRSLIVGSDNWYHYAFSSTGELLWEYLSIHASSAGAAVDLDGDSKQEVIAGTQYYSWHAITPDGKKKWAINRVGPGANSVAAITPSDAGKPTVYVAGADGNIYAFDPDGNRPWTFNTGDGATCMELIDINSDGKTDIVTGTLNSNLIALDATGKRLWRQDVGEPVLTMVQADLNGKGTREIVVGTEDGHVKAFTTNGEPFAEWATSGPVNKLVALPKGRVAAALKDGKLVVLGM